MADYSHTKLDTFRQCRMKYKLKYIDGIKYEKTRSIETFMGDKVHRALETMYDHRNNCRYDSEEEVLAYYDSIWDKEYNDKVTIANEDYTAENYREVGRQCLINYLREHPPEDPMTILGVETEKTYTLPNGKTYDIRIDKLGCIGKDYYVCDYKTNGRMKTQEEVDEDEQLAMYSLWVKDNYPDAESVSLVWHMLRFGKDVKSSRTDGQLKELVDGICDLISEIESCEEWPTNVSGLCDYCEFKGACPEFAHLVKIETIEESEPEMLNEDEAYQAMTTIEELDMRKHILKEELDSVDKEMKELEKQVIDYAVGNNLTAVYGPTKKCSVKKDLEVKKAEGTDVEEVKKILFDKGLLDYFMLTTKLGSELKKGTAPEEVKPYYVVTEKYTASLSAKKK